MTNCTLTYDPEARGDERDQRVTAKLHRSHTQVAFGGYKQARCGPKVLAVERLISRTSSQQSII